MFHFTFVRYGVRYALLFLAALSLGGTVPLVLGGREALEVILTASWLRITALSVFLLIVWNLNALRPRLIFYRRAYGLSQFQAVALTLACDFAGKVTPGGAGAPYVAALIMRQFRVREARAISAFLIVTVLDVAITALLLVIIVGGGLMELGGYSREIVFAGFAVLLCILVGAAFALNYRDSTIRFVYFLAVSVVRCPRRRRRVARQLILFRAGVKECFFLPVWILVCVFGVSIAFWLAQTSILYAALLVLGVQLPWVNVAAIQIVSMGVGRLFLLPAGAGGAELSATMLLSLMMDPCMAAAGVLLWRGGALYFGSAAGLMAGAYFLARRRYDDAID